ncbi:MAG: universal stress protein [Desulfarculaceae bacterium]|nr:universal stress protein [Desulfarculaceae bacterium]MCF8071577.1 universal stress protein [Desulfarculaceae bacterium]MCF8102392.1 universal stress protein [Desulfarculaceae bacterium]MCF8114856.1 universal stress protein [Desulfarculaceae bacterium]
MAECQVKYQKIMAAIDLSKYSPDTFQHAQALAKGLGAELILLNVINTRYLDNAERYGGEGMGIDREKAVDLARADRKATIEKDFLSQAGGVNVRLVFREGLPWEEVVAGAKAEQADLLVVGTKGRSDVAGALFGSVAEKVQRHAPCPVLSVRGPEHCRLSK